MRPASEYLPNRSWASHNGLDLNEQSKNGNYRNVILNVSVSHNTFVSNRMCFGDCLKTWEEEYGTYHFRSRRVDCCPAVRLQKTCCPTRVVLAELSSETGKELSM